MNLNKNTDHPINAENNLLLVLPPLSLMGSRTWHVDVLIKTPGLVFYNTFTDRLISDRQVEFWHHQNVTTCRLVGNAVHSLLSTQDQHPIPKK